MSAELLKKPFANHGHIDSYMPVNSELCIFFSIILLLMAKKCGFVRAW